MHGKSSNGFIHLNQLDAVLASAYHIQINDMASGWTYPKLSKKLRPVALSELSEGREGQIQTPPQIPEGEWIDQSKPFVVHRRDPQS